MGGGSAERGGAGDARATGKTRGSREDLGGGRTACVGSLGSGTAVADAEDITHPCVNIRPLQTHGRTPCARTRAHTHTHAPRAQCENGNRCFAERQPRGWWSDERTGAHEAKPYGAGPACGRRRGTPVRCRYARLQELGLPFEQNQLGLSAGRTITTHRRIARIRSSPAAAAGLQRLLQPTGNPR